MTETRPEPESADETAADPARVAARSTGDAVRTETAEVGAGEVGTGEAAALACTAGGADQAGGETAEAETVEADAAGAETADGEREWWDDPRLPWKHKPTRHDIACYVWIAVLGVYGLIMLPLRPVLLANPPVSAIINGGRTSVVATGAWLEVHGGPIVLYWAVVSLSILKFDWVYWWAGKLWGTAILESFTGRSKLSQRRAELVLKFTHRYETLAVVATYLPLPLPMALIYAAVGASGMRLRKFLVIDIVTATVMQAAYLALGWWIGEPAVRIVTIYANYSWYLTIAILVGMVAAWWWRNHRRPA